MRRSPSERHHICGEGFVLVLASPLPVRLLLGMERSPHQPRNHNSQQRNRPTKRDHSKIYGKQSWYCCFVGIEPAQIELVRIFQTVLVIYRILGPIENLGTPAHITAIEVVQVLYAAEPGVSTKANDPNHRQDYADTQHAWAISADATPALRTRSLRTRRGRGPRRELWRLCQS